MSLGSLWCLRVPVAPVAGDRAGPRRLLLHAGFVAPVLVLLLWVRPLSRDLLLQAPLGTRTVQLLSAASFDSARLWALVALALLRLAGTRQHLQAYLGLAPRWARSIRREAGRIPALEIQRKVGIGVGIRITRIYCYVSVVSLQYLGPIILSLHCTLLLKTLESPDPCPVSPREPNGALCPVCPQASTPGGCTPCPRPCPPPCPRPCPPPCRGAEDAQEAAQEIWALLRCVCAPPLLRGLFSFLTWWVAACQVVTSLFGLYFHRYLAAS
ncbi:hypothetical protein DUI87_33812 [Hirundo rustica rustica]|uniref:Transmembrane protein 161A n=1 Tax=Hirundo rustica rustica TaxID=333673 RepID=A0A3M0ILF7_HIRRU|nr:hypothetical protein DUI87_33812 [Hirundo rustica rustica]